MATGTVEERVSRLEGAYDHLATKADIAELKAELIKWMVSLMMVSIGVASTIAFTAVRLFGA